MSQDIWESSVVTHFNEYASTYADGYRSGSIFGYFFRRRQKLVTDLLDRITGRAILDVGCGPGVYGLVCVQRGFLYTGLDISPQMVEEGRKLSGPLGPKARYVVGKIQNLSFASQTFDVILCLGALEYVQDFEEDPSLIELSRVLKPGGTIIFSCANRRSPYRLWSRAYSQIANRIANRPSTPLREFTASAFSRSLQKHGLTTTEVHYFAINLFLSPFENKCRRQAVWAASKLERFAGTWLGSFGMAFIVRADKTGAAQRDAEAM